MADLSSKTRHSGHLVDIDEFKATGSGALSQTLNIDKSCELIEVRLHLGSAATQETFSVSVDSGDGTAYDVVLFAYDMSQDLDGNPGVVTDVVWRPDVPVLVNENDDVVLSWTNTDAATWGLKILIKADTN